MKNSKGHLLAIFTVFVWGSTFSSTKALLIHFSSYEILIFRFIIAYICLFIFYPRVLKPTSIKEEILFGLCGLSGVCLYFLLENIALEYTFASNAGVLVSINPIYTAILGFIFFKKQLNKFFIIGFLFSLVGVICIVYKGDSPVHINPLGDILCILAGLCWSIYTILLEKLFKTQKNIHTLAITKKIFFYGVIFSSMTLFVEGINPSLDRFLNLKDILNLLFLGVVASALCYLSWGISMKLLGTLKASAYMYTVPIISVIIASITLGESITYHIAIGSILVLCGLFLSQKT
ncbi:DMT family transporter [Helicobacter cappadocius]|uniref:DMT family transporter n=1 Tax=Helicobacter cappadocius TaxID=3063998 RepID=A0AA90SSK8_9HELI|nr:MULTISPECIES: DMT family transporter [unclassified Helicobacter]MDO7252997.1 DMT family transporter [Helicobacter sp. faydin-H75]MDP2539014.1 DMT family transporter [Helicobacter sp. faydin-H76]